MNRNIEDIKQKDMAQNAELLAPAGDYSTAIAALNAGADAVYLGAPSFSARAFAKNLTTEEIIQVIHYAHLWGKKVYLAINILIKNEEFQQACNTIAPLYEAGLDGVIVQDLGLFHIIPVRFPELELHASTQMAILSEGGVFFCRDHNAVRVVPGRELSIGEIKELKKTGVALECFIHGAMCYSYSGRCLMSSLAGGRSGNRGRCAGPCRKAYALEEGKDNQYLLSMKDMCALPVLGELLEAGVDSLKIEGRMKNAKYAAGVSYIYRKYLDEPQKISPSDMEFLRNLYIRTDIQKGYYHRANGKEMITLHNPSYRSIRTNQQKEINDVLKPFLDGIHSKPITMEIFVYVGQRSRLILHYEQITITQEGAVAETALKKPISEDEISQRMAKLGDTMFFAQKIIVHTDGASFLPVSSLNELRRGAVRQLEETVFMPMKRMVRKDVSIDLSPAKVTPFTEKKIIWKASVKNRMQMLAVLQSGITEIILDWDFFSKDRDNALAFLRKTQENHQYNPDESCCRFYLRLPDIIRQKHYEPILRETKELWQTGIFCGLYCTCLDALGIAKNLLGHTMLTKDMIYGDVGIPVFNVAAEEAVLEEMGHYTASYELNAGELAHFAHKDRREIVVYGYQEIMHSANCVLLTGKKCDPDRTVSSITDESGRKFPVFLHHDLCYNTIYNYLPLSLHQQINVWEKRKEGCAFRFQFTLEDEKTCKKVLSFFRNLENGDGCDTGFAYTNGHSKRGVE